MMLTACSGWSNCRGRYTEVSFKSEPNPKQLGQKHEQLLVANYALRQPPSRKDAGRNASPHRRASIKKTREPEAPSNSP